MSRYVIGIDPGTQTGFAVYDTLADALVHISTMDFWMVYQYMNLWDRMEYPIKGIVIEVSKQNRVWHKTGGSLKNIQTTALNVGRVLRESELLAKGLKEELGYGRVVAEVEPRGKTNQTRFKQLTKWEGRRLNQHERDAAMLCYRWRQDRC